MTDENDPIPASESARTKVTRSAVGIAKSVARVYVLYAVLLFFLQRFIIFPGGCIDVSEARPPIGTHVQWFDTSSGRTEAWLVPPTDGDLQGAPVVVFVHGNGELIDHFVSLAQPARDLGYAILLVEYPGYGRSDGSTSRNSILAAHEQAYDWLANRTDVDVNRIAFFGRSMGGAVACDLAERRPSTALVLMSSFTQLSAFAPKFALPTILVRDRFNCRATLQNYDNPVLVFHGERDDLVPFTHGQILAEAANHGTFVPLNCMHNDCPPDHVAVWSTVDAFLRRAQGMEPTP